MNNRRSDMREQRQLPARLTEASLFARSASLRLVGFCALVLLGWIKSPAALHADELHLNDGRVITGKVARDGEDYVVSFDGGALARYSATEVLRVEKLPTVRERYANLKAVADPDDFKAQIELANWCRLNLLPDEAKEHFHRAAELKPDNAAALKGAGYLQYEGRWVSREEALELQGKTIYNGKEMTVLEAAELKRLSESKRLQEEGYTKAWLLLRSAAEKKSGEDLAQIRQSLQEMGDLAGGAVQRCATDSNPRVRSLCLELLGKDEQKASRKVLFARLSFETIPALVHKAAKQLAARSDREAVLRQTMEVCMQSPHRGIRLRAWLVLRYMEEKQALTQLIDAVAFCPVPTEMRKEDKKSVGNNGWESSEDSDRLKKPYYPACEALNFLTGANIPPDKARWQKWWEQNGAAFDFKTRVSESQDTTEAEKETEEKQEPGKNKGKPAEPTRNNEGPAPKPAQAAGKKE